MVRGESRARRDHDELERSRALFGLLAVVISNVAIAAVAIFGVWRLHGDSAVTVGILTSAFTAVSTLTTAYLSIKAVSNTARSIALGDTSGRGTPQPAPTAPVPAPSTPSDD
ncbi:hypothetical protein [Streptomyces sp. SID12488]|uniref:hypothetical protein n=1 Tax=Streptomyces sp. SID12488 TaxID=2706040 RepID=UPI001EF201A7|nr:hypothetical protein [Streptomyces sp. SID12488]